MNEIDTQAPTELKADPPHSTVGKRNYFTGYGMLLHHPWSPPHSISRKPEQHALCEKDAT